MLSIAALTPTYAIHAAQPPSPFALSVAAQRRSRRGLPRGFDFAPFGATLSPNGFGEPSIGDRKAPLREFVCLPTRRLGRASATAKAGCRSEHPRSGWPKGRAAGAARNNDALSVTSRFAAMA